MARTPSYGTCALCGKRTTKAGMTRHLDACPAEHDATGGEEAELLHLRVQDAYAPLYWLDLEVRADRPLRDLDDFLRSAWLECCGHPSRFDIDGVRYSVAPDSGGWSDSEERGMEVRIGDALSPGTVFTHEYDFGTPTELELKAVGTRIGRIGRAPLRLLARNEAPAQACAGCGAPAAWVDAEALWTGDGSPFLCGSCAEGVEDEGALLPVVNSPRMGVCGYAG